MATERPKFGSTRRTYNRHPPFAEPFREDISVHFHPGPNPFRLAGAQPPVVNVGSGIETVVLSMHLAP